MRVGERTQRRSLRVACGLVAAAALAACGPSSAPVTWPADDDLGLPAVEWPYGAPPVLNAWVAALLDASVAVAVAHDAQDFTGAALGQRVGEDLVDRYAGGAGPLVPPTAGASSTAPFVLGPRPLVVTDLVVDGSRAVVTVCTVAGGHGDDDRPRTAAELRALDEGTVGVLELVRGDDGRIRLTDDLTPEHEQSCHLDDLRMGYFRPGPAAGGAAVEPVHGRDAGG